MSGKALPAGHAATSKGATPKRATLKPTPTRSKDPAARSGPGYNYPTETLPDVREEAWPTGLRALLLRERQRIIDLFRHWEGGGEGGSITAEHFKAGLFVLGYRISRADVADLYEAMGVAPEAHLRFAELRRQLRVVTQKGCSAYLRGAAKQGLELESTSTRGELLSGVAELKEREPEPSEHDGPDLAAALMLSPAPVHHSLMSAASRNGSSSARGGLMGGIASSREEFGEGVVGLGADATSGKERSLAAAAEAAHQVHHGSQSLLASEMWLQQWARSHYSTLLPELRKWEIYPEGCITFHIFADSLHALGFPGAGRWLEVESVFYSWEPDEHGRLHWQTVRARMTGGRMVRVQTARHNTASYYKQASRAGEGFGNRSSSRFKHANNSFVGPGKYSPAHAVKGKSGGGKHSGNLKSTAPRFQQRPASAAPGPGKYQPRHTLQDKRTEIQPHYLA